MKDFNEKLKLSLIIISLAFTNYSCLSSLQKQDRLLNGNQKDCNTLQFLKSDFKNGYNHSKYIGSTKTYFIEDEKVKIIQDSIQIILKSDTFNFHKFLESGLINGQIFIQDLDFLRSVQNYEEKEIPNIKNTFTIYGITELKCNEFETDTKKYKFYACIGDVSTNGIIYYLEFKKNLKKEDNPNTEIYLQSFGMSI